MRIIILHELQKQLKSTHFVVLLATCCILFVINSVIYIQQYQEDVAHFSETTASPYPSPSTVSTEIYSRPNPLLFISASGEKNLPLGYIVKPTGIIEPLPAHARNYKFPSIPDIDWIFVIIHIFSLYTIILGHNMISGEKESGTISLLLANAISRTKVLLAKYVSLILTVSIPLIAGVTLNLIIVCMYIPDAMSGTVFGELAVILLLAMFYVSIFAVLSIFVSSVFHNSSMAAIMLLFLWASLLSFPSVSEIIVNKYITVPSE